MERTAPVLDVMASRIQAESTIHVGFVVETTEAVLDAMEPIVPVQDVMESRTPTRPTMHVVSAEGTIQLAHHLLHHPLQSRLLQKSQSGHG